MFQANNVSAYVKPNVRIYAVILLYSSWVYQVDQLYFFLPPKIDTSSFQPNGAWALVDTATLYRVEQNFATARFIIYITRKPHYFLFTLILPCILLSSIMLLVFLLPPESGEKVSLQITVLLSFTVFQLVVSSNMTHTSDYAPLMGKCSDFNFL